MHPQAQPIFSRGGAQARIPQLLSVLLPAVLCAVLCGCDDSPPAATSAAAPATPSAPPTAEPSYPEAVVSFNAPFPNLYLEGTDKELGKYYSFGIKITYTIEADGSLKMQHRDEEQMLDDDPPSP